MFARYVAALALAEAVGIGVVSVTYAALDRGLLGAQGWILMAGGVEGLCIGTAQAVVLRACGVRPGRLLVLTVIGAVAGYGLSLLGGAGTAEGPEPGPVMIALLGLGMGFGMGALMGLIQLPGLGPRLPHRPWVVFTTLGWMPAMAIILLAATTASAEWSLARIALSGALSGALAGACVALATWQAVLRA